MRWLIVVVQMVYTYIRTMDVQMRDFSDLLLLSTRIRTAYNAGEMWSGALSGRENWTPILVIQGLVTIMHFASSSYCAIVLIGISLRLKMECCYHITTIHIYARQVTSQATSYIQLL